LQRHRENLVSGCQADIPIYGSLKNGQVFTLYPVARPCPDYFMRTQLGYVSLVDGWHIDTLTSDAIHTQQVVIVKSVSVVRKESLNHE
jgi:hypothetical protein